MSFCQRLMHQNNFKAALEKKFFGKNGISWACLFPRHLKTERFKTLQLLRNLIMMLNLPSLFFCLFLFSSRVLLIFVIFLLNTGCQNVFTWLSKGKSLLWENQDLLSKKCNNSSQKNAESKAPEARREKNKNMLCFKDKLSNFNEAF